MKKSVTTHYSAMMITTKSSKKRAAKPKAADRGAAASKECGRITVKLLDDLICLQNKAQVSLPKGDYIRATHFLEAPIEKIWEAVCHQNNDNSHDLHVFLKKGAFALLKCASEEDMDTKVITVNHDPNF